MTKKATLIAMVLGVCLLAVGGYVGYRFLDSTNHMIIENNAEKAAPAVVAQTAKPKVVESSYLVSGDVFWSRGVNIYSLRSSLKYDWPFSRLNEFSPKDYDGWIVDMECPVSYTSVPYQTEVDRLIFSCSPNYLKAATKYFDIFTLANNHTGNLGLEGFTETQKNIDKAGAQYFGHYDIGQKNDLCEVVSVNSRVDGKEAKLPVAMCGIHWLYRTPTSAELATIADYAKYLPVWVLPHGGVEYQKHSNEAQQTLYRKFINLGADVVLGAHPHTIQETEAYKGKLIVYSMGNLIFDQWFDDEVTKSMVVNIELTSTVDSNVQGWLDIADNCTKFKDNCLKLAKTKGLKPINRSYRYNLLAGDTATLSAGGDLRKHLASKTTKKWMLDRADWANTLKGLANTSF